MNSVINTFQSEKIPVYRPGDEEYERSVATANLLFRFARPACVVQPERPSQIQTIIKQAKARNIRVTIKNGGHSYAGFSTADKGISLDLSKMKGVKLDMKSEIVTLQGGAQWGHAYKQLVNGRHDGYIINGGRCPTVGVSGFILGGGLGPFTRSFGMGCDTLEQATLVTADGDLVTVKDSDDPTSDKGRLFWALCGAGGGNFGVVVELKMRIQKLQSEGGKVVAGRYRWLAKSDDMDGFLKTMNRFYTTDWPDQITLDSTWMCDLQERTSELGVRFLVYFDGDKDDFDKLIDKNIKHKELAKQLKRRSLPEKSTRFLHETLVSQWSEETIKSFPSNRSYSIFTSFVFKNGRDRIKSITSIIREEMAAFRDLFPGEQALLEVTWIHAGGEASRKKRSATAFRWRDCVYHTYIMLRWQEKWLERDMRGFLQKFKERLKPFSMMKRAAFINFPDGTLSSNAHEKAYFGNNRQELQRVKQIWDRDNFFNWAQGVRLPESEETAQASIYMAQRMFSPGTARNMAETGDEEGPSEPPLANMQVPMANTRVPMGDDEEASDEDEEVDEQGLTDMVAAQQWESVELPSTNAFVGGGGGLALTDLGF